MDFNDFITRFWGLILAVGSIIAAWVLGMKQSQWAIADFKEQMSKLEKRVEHLETQGHSGAATLAGIAATLASIQSTLADIKEELRRKADKP